LLVQVSCPKNRADNGDSATIFLAELGSVGEPPSLKINNYGLKQPIAISELFL